MDKLKSNKSQLMCTLAMAITVVGFAAERIITIAFAPEQKGALIMAIVYTALLGIVYLLISQSKDYFSGLLAALVGYKMMPPNISALSTTPDGDMLYFIVRKAALVLFVVLILKFYEMQEKPRAIKPVPLLAIMVLVPFFDEISNHAASYLMYETGSMLYCYLVDFACYGIAIFATLVIAYRNGYQSMAFTAFFEYIALGINILRRATAVVVKLTQGEHVSKSYYVWIALYVGLIIIAAVLKKRKQKTIEA